MINIYIIRVSEDARPDRYFKLSLKNKVPCKIYYLEFKNRITDTFGQRVVKSNKKKRQSARD